jgi:hypothetical protein
MSTIFHKCCGSSKDVLENFLIEHDLEKSDSSTPSCFSLLEICCKKEDQIYRTNFNSEYINPLLEKVEPKLY